MADGSESTKLPRYLVISSAIVGLAGTLSAGILAWRTFEIEKFKAVEVHKLEVLKASQANELENLKERHADDRARATHAADMKKSLWRDAVDAKIPIEQRMSTLRLIQTIKNDTYAPDEGFTSWADKEYATLQSAQAEAASRPPQQRTVTCKEKEQEPCSKGTVFACVVGLDGDQMDGQTVKTTEPDAIIYGTWANDQCRTSGEGWHMKIGSCGKGGGTLYKQCKEVRARLP